MTDHENDDHEKFAPREPGDERSRPEVPTSEGAASGVTAGGTTVSEEEAVARLRAADPAADVEPSETFPAVVAQRAAADGDDDAGDPDGADVAPVAPPVDLASRRRRSWFAPAVAAAAAAVIGVSGYALGTSAGSGGGDSMADSADESSAVEEAQRADGSSSDAAGPISLGASPESAAEAQGPAAGGAPEMSGADSADRSMAGSSAADSMMVGPGRSTFSASGLSTAERSAQAYGLDAAASSTPERLAQVAQALGMTGAPEITDGAWTLTEGAKQLYVGLDGTLSLNYSDSDAYPWCEGCEEPRPEDAPSGDAAIERLKELLAALGEDPAQFEYSAPTYEGAVTASAQARRVIDGQATDLSFTLELAPAGVASVWGGLAGVVDLGAYPVVSEQEGLERLSDSRFGGYRSSWPMPADGDMGVMQEWTPPTEAPAPPEPGTAVDWPVLDVEIVSARLGLAQQWQPDGTVLLVPSYEFTDSDGGTWSVIAVAEEMLDLSAD